MMISYRGGEKMTLLWYFLAGFFAANCLPHIIKGITGQTHMTPFKRVSSPVLNVVWGFTNVVITLFVLGVASGNGGLTLPWSANLSDMNLIAFLVGAFACAAYLGYFWSNPKARLPWQKD